MVTSAESGYWNGRILRVYMSTARFNLRRRKLFTALSRLGFGLAGFVLAGRHILSSDYWQGVKAHHPPDTLHFIMETFEQDARLNTA
jgi:hypothetical protein